VVEVKSLRFRILSGDDCVRFHDSQDVNRVVSLFVITVVSELSVVTPPGIVEGGFGGSHREIVEMVLSFCVVYAAVATIGKSANQV